MHGGEWSVHEHPKIKSKVGWMLCYNYRNTYNSWMSLWLLFAQQKVCENFGQKSIGTRQAAKQKSPQKSRLQKWMSCGRSLNSDTCDLKACFTFNSFYFANEGENDSMRHAQVNDHVRYFWTISFKTLRCIAKVCVHNIAQWEFCEREKKKNLMYVWFV